MTDTPKSEPLPAWRILADGAADTAERLRAQLDALLRLPGNPDLMTATERGYLEIAKTHAQQALRNIGLAQAEPF